MFFYASLLILNTVAFTTVNGFLTSEAVFWLSLGGGAYILGTMTVVFRPKIVLNKFFKTHEYLAFPLVMLGSFSHFWAMFVHVLYI